MSTKKYHIAFSFEGKDRNKIAEIKNQLEKQHNVKIFLDQHESGDLQSSNPLDRLYEIFKNDAEYVVTPEKPNNLLKIGILEVI